MRRTSAAASGGLGLLAVVLALCTVGSVEGQTNGYVIGNTPLDTTGSSFYGFYGFYGFVDTPHNPLFCDVVAVKFNLYNYGSVDLTSINTIQYIIDQTKEAIDLTFMEANPTASTDSYKATVTELDGSAVTFVTVTAEIDFQDNVADGATNLLAARALGGQFASACGVTSDDVSGDVSTRMFAPDSPSTGVCSLGFDIVVRGYQQDILQNDENEMVAFQTALEASFQSAILKSTGDKSAAAGATIELIGITDAYSNGVAVRMYVHFSEGEDTCKDFESKLLADSYSMGNKFGVLENRIKVVETVDVTDETDRRRSLLQSGTVGSAAQRAIGDNAELNLISKNVAKAGLGVNSVEPGSAECRVNSEDSTGEGSSDGAFGTSDGPPTSDSANTGPGVSTELGAAGGGGGGGSGSDSADYHSFYGFYGSSDDSSFYGIYGVGIDSAAGGDSSAAGGDSSATGTSAGGKYSSAMGTSFYGYTDSAPSAPSGPSSPSGSSSSPSGGGSTPSTGPAVPVPPVSTPAAATYPVYFTTILSDYNLEDIAAPEDRAAFTEQYVGSVGQAIGLLGITSQPDISVLDIRAASIAVDTMADFSSEPEAQLFMDVINSNPSLVFPAFSSIGSLELVDIGTTPPNFQAGSDPATEQDELNVDPCVIDKEGACCMAPGILDASKTCCMEAVDECGVCGGDSTSCGASVSIQVTVPEGTGAPSAEEVKTLLLSALMLEANQIEVAASNVPGVNSSTGTNYEYIVTFLPPAPSAEEIQQMFAGMMADGSGNNGSFFISEVELVQRSGVCGNSICEVGESFESCPSDCPETVPDAGTTLPKNPVEGVNEQDAGTASGSGSSTGMIVGIVVAVVAAVVIAGVAYYLLVVRKKNDTAREEGLGYADVPQSRDPTTV